MNSVFVDVIEVRLLGREKAATMGEFDLHVLTLMPIYTQYSPFKDGQGRNQKLN